MISWIKGGREGEEGGKKEREREREREPPIVLKGPRSRGSRGGGKRHEILKHSIVLRGCFLSMTGGGEKQQPKQRWIIHQFFLPLIIRWGGHRNGIFHITPLRWLIDGAHSARRKSLTNSPPLPPPLLIFIIHNSKKKNFYLSFVFGMWTLFKCYQILEMCSGFSRWRLKNPVSVFGTFSAIMMKFH